MALKDKLMTLEDFKAVRDVDVASNSAQFTEINESLDNVRVDLGAQTSELKLALLPFIEHLIGTFDDGNGGEYTENLLAVLRAAAPEPVVNMVKSENLIGTSAQLYTDEGTTAQESLKTSGSSCYYLDSAATENCTYKVTVTITPELNTYTYKAVYAYNAEILNGKGTAAPTAYNVTSSKPGGIINTEPSVGGQPLEENYVFETEVSVKAGRNLAIIFYRDYATCIESVTAQKVV